VPSFPQIVTTILIAAIAFGAIAFGIWWSANEVGLLEHQDESEAPSPSMQLVSDEQDLGRVAAGSTHQVSFCIANTGKEPLELWQFLPQDSGDKDSYPALIVEPGRVGELIVELSADTLFRSGMRRVRFHTNDPARPDLWLTIRGIVASPVPAAAHSELTP
jgi:hypothetical protein